MRHTSSVVFVTTFGFATLATLDAAGQTPPAHCLSPGEEVHTVRLRGVSPGATWTLRDCDSVARPPKTRRVKPRPGYPKCYGPNCPPTELEEPDGPPIDPPLAQCGEHGCTLALPAGTYRLWVQGPRGSGIARGYRELTVTSDMDLEARAPKKKAKWGGLATACVGHASLAVGSLFVMYGALMSFTGECEDCNGWSQRQVLGTGATLVGIGVVAIPTGWILFATNRRPKLKPAGSDALARRPSVRFGLQAFSGGYGLGAYVSF